MGDTGVYKKGSKKVAFIEFKGSKLISFYPANKTRLDDEHHYISI